MLTGPDRRVVARDPALPGLALLLDDERLLDTLRGLWPEAEIETVDCTYLRYKPGVNCLAGYAAQTPAGPLMVYARAYTAAHYTEAWAGECGAKAKVRTYPPQMLDREAVVLRRFPDDRKLRGMARLVLPDSRSGLLSKMLPKEPALWEAQPATLRYKPERRYVARLQADGAPSAVVKVYGEEDFDNAWRGSGAFATREHLVIARRLGHSKRRRAIVSQWLPGGPLDQWLRAPDFDLARICEVGAALAELHRQTPRNLNRRSREDEALAVLAAVNAAAGLHAALAERLRGLGVRIAGALMAEPSVESAIHGDFHGEQVILDTSGIGIIDYDRSALGDPSADFGSFLARLTYEEMLGILPLGRAEGIGEGLVDGYCSRARCSRPSGIALQTAAALLQFTPHAFRQREPAWPGVMESLSERAEQAFQEHLQPRTAAPRALDGGRGAS